MGSLTETAIPSFGGFKKYLKHVNHGLSAVTFINKSYFVSLEVTATVTGLFYLLLKSQVSISHPVR